ncbi:P-loop containing nucleoside triphosphate hydrolase protein [Ilyonectria destructans]|nr:P-loop containing nucleoside triphosphate hydrolase protein [Ilyonectria destructans]
MSPSSVHIPGLPPAPSLGKSFWRPCALVIGGLQGTVFGGKTLGVTGSEIDTAIHFANSSGYDPWMGFSVDIPLGESDEEDGLGTSHPLRGNSSSPKPVSTSKITVKFPRDQFLFSVEPLDPALHCLFTSGNQDLAVLDVCIKDGAKVEVEGFGMPPSVFRFQEPASTPSIRVKALSDIIRKTSFTFVVKRSSSELKARWDDAKLSEPLTYPYGNVHSWNPSRYPAMLLAQQKTFQFPPAWKFSDDNSHLTALTQSLVQDFWWLHEVTLNIKNERFHAYFVEKPTTVGQAKTFYAIVPLPQDFKDRYLVAWHHLTMGDPASNPVRLSLQYDPDACVARWDDELLNWSTMIVEHPATIPALRTHDIRKSDLVLLVCPSSAAVLKTFESRTDAQAALERGEQWDCVALHFDIQLHEVERKVNAVCLFDPYAQPSNDSDDLAPGSYARPGVLENDDPGVEDLQPDLENGKHVLINSLPVCDLLSTPSDSYNNGLLEEVLPHDRKRFHKYFSERPLGLGIITGDPGFGKTTTLAIAALAMRATTGKVLASALTHASVDNLAARLHSVTTRPLKLQFPRMMVVCAYAEIDEYAAFMALVEDPRKGDLAGPRDVFGIRSAWKLPLSVAYWLLVCLARRKDFGSLRAVTVGHITWNQYMVGERVPKQTVESLLRSVVEIADILCTTPTLAFSQPSLSRWKNNSAKGIAVDDATSIDRPELYSIWGNTLLPCILAGSEKQLAPVPVLVGEPEILRAAVNKFGQEKKISALEFIKASGWPVYRLRTQFRMVKGQFELCKAVVNADSDIEFKYGPGTEIDLPGHSTGRAFESFVTSNYPDITPAAPGSLEPIFIHCPSTSVRVDPVTRSFQNTEQVEISLSFLCDFVSATKVDPGQILIIGPSTAMVETIACIRNEPEYAALRTMPLAMTADSMQGHDGGEMVVAILGTNKGSGAGFLADERRISLMLSRHRSALVIVSNLYVTGPKKQLCDRKKGPKRWLDSVLPRTMVRTAEGDIATIKPKMLRKAQHMMCDAGRVIEIQFRKRLDVEGENGDDDDEGGDDDNEEKGDGRSGDNESK